MRCLLFYAERGVWLGYKNPKTILETDRIERVAPLLSEVDCLCDAHQWSAVGFVSYEAGPAFDPLYPAHTEPSLITLPLARFAFFDSCTEYAELPDPRDWDTDPALHHGYPADSWAISSWRGQPKFSVYQNTFLEIKHELERGMSYQINLTWRQNADFSGSSYAWFSYLCKKKPGSYIAYLEWEDRAVLSLSPELFFRLDGTRLTLKPMKGTAQPTDDAQKNELIADELYRDKKNRAENLMICDMIRNDAGRIAELGSVTVPELYTTEIFPTVIQMTSTVQAQLFNKKVADIFKALFPCASITGAPKLSSMHIIERLEKTQRGLYTGAIGRIDGKSRDMVFNIAIRTAVVDRGRHRCEYGVGSGIVWDSEAKSEYAECLIKTRVIEPDTGFYVLESLLLDDGRYWLKERHCKRLEASCQYFCHPLDLGHLEQGLQVVASTCPNGRWKVRVTVEQDGHVCCTADPTPELPQPYTLGLCPMPIDPQDPFLLHKTSCRTVFDQALNAFRKLYPDAADTILWNVRGELTETCRANLVLELDGKQYTPPLSSGLLPGVLRAELVESGVLTERLLYREDLIKADGIWIINSVRGKIPVQCYHF